MLDCKKNVCKTSVVRTVLCRHGYDVVLFDFVATPHVPFCCCSYFALSVGFFFNVHGNLFPC